MDFKVRSGEYGKQDRDVFTEVYEEDCYRLCSTIFPEPSLIVDLGAHIGAFARLAHEKFPSSHIVCVEAAPENIWCLQENVGEFAGVIHAACFYAEEELFLYNSIQERGGVATGGSIVVTEKRIARETFPPIYWLDRRHLPKITLEEITYGRRIDILKMDVEGSEFNILSHANLSCVGTILGEFHTTHHKWNSFCKRYLSDWQYQIWNTGKDYGGIFRLTRKNG